MKVLVIEDEQKVARFLKKGLEAEGFEVDVAEDGEKGEKAARTEQYDVILLDVLLPVKDGFSILRDLRHDKIKTPIIMLTARSDTEDIVGGLEQGADDYLCKPFSFDVLLARIRSVLRRSAQSQVKLKYKDLVLDTVTHKAQRGGKTIELTSREYALLEYFMRNQGKLITRSELAREVWGYNFDPGTNVVDVYVTHLRKKIDSEHKVKLFQTERGKGYYLSDKKLSFK
ncbi:MAG: response regulator transcription factor [Bacteroidetes bacterium]|nr:response regulator transcription factor [Bacteroidota bacterium]